MKSDSDRDRGVALIAAIGVMAVLMIVVMTISASSLSATGFATSTRAGVQSRGAADAGVDAVRANLMGGTFVCSLAGTNPTFLATVSYADSAGTALSCAGGFVSGTPRSARITSKGQASVIAVAGSHTEDTATIGATVDLVVTPSGVSLTKAVFSEGSFELTNNTSVGATSVSSVDGNLYSNGNIVCKTDLEIQGTVYSRGDLSIENTCKTLGTIWSGGNIDFHSSNVKIDGDVFAAGTGTFVLGQAHVGGSVIANGPVTMANSASVACGASMPSANICGSVYSLNSTITMGNNAKILGSAYARGTINIGNSGGTTVGQNVVSLTGNLEGSNKPSIGGIAKLGGTFNSSNVTDGNATWCDASSATSVVPACVSPDPYLPMPTAASPAFAVSLPLFSPAGATNMGTAANTVKVVAPQREAMPQIPSSPADLLSKWAGWTRKSVTDGTLCNAGNDFESRLDSLTAGQTASTKVLIVITGCGGPVTMDNRVIKLKGDTAFMSSTGFASANDLTIQSTDGAAHELSWIVPSDAPSVTWAASDPTNYPGQLSPVCTGTSMASVAVNKAALQNGNTWFIYAPCRVTFQNYTAFTGQIYAGAVGFPGGGKIVRANMTVPGVVVPGGAGGAGSFSATLTSRYDVDG